MYTIFLAGIIGTLIAIVPLAFGASSTWTVLPGMIAGLVSFLLINRRIAKRVEAVTAAADQEMANLQSLAQRGGGQAQANVIRSIDAGVARLKSGLIFRKWQLGVGTMLNARIGMLLFSKSMMLSQFGNKNGRNEALLASIPFLESSQIKGRKAQLLHALWPAWAMLAVAHYQTTKASDKLAKSIEVLEEAVKASKKTGMLWCLYAWLLWKEKRLDDAISVLARGAEVVPDDKYLKDNLHALQNRKGMKMKPYGEQWYQFGLEKPRAAAQQQRMGHPRMRGSMRRR